MGNLTDMYAQVQGSRPRGNCIHIVALMLVHTYQSSQECTCYKCYFIAIVTTLVGWIPQVTVTVSREVIIIGKDLKIAIPTFTYCTKFTLCTLKPMNNCDITLWIW